jgi:hypothetical protein
MKKIIAICICATVIIGGFFTYKAMASAPKDTLAAGECTLYDGDAKADDTKGKIKAEEAKIDIVKGEYVGQIDGNSIEVKINGEATALYFSPEISDTFSSKKLKSKDKVTLSFYKNKNGQNILSAIDKD